MNEREIFIEGVEKQDREERSAFLDAACGQDTELRKKVERLFAEHARDDSFFLDSPPPGMDAIIDQPITEGPGTVIGRYKLLERIGEGGFGDVYRAEQAEPVHRQIALKIIKLGMDTKEVIARFEAERQALAMMNHPNIAKVHDAGATKTGRPYFVMELVRGVPITEHCDANNLTSKERLRLFIDVCYAVQHAHQKGIIHRDIKPSNVMVAQDDGVPVPKVIDFGIAKATDRHLTERTVSTSSGQMVGTPLYMSPEQAEMSGLDIDSRSDVYSLGVLFYELLTGSTPFDGERIREAGYDEIRRMIREEEPPRPSERISTLAAAATTVSMHRSTNPAMLANALRGELDWIVMKALEKDRTRRYASANELAKDVQRYLDDEAVEACPPSTAYRLRKFARRNKTGLAAAAVVVLTLLAGIGTTTWQAVLATRAAADADLQRKEAERQQEVAQENFRRARAAVDEYLTRVSEEQLLNAPGLQTLRKELLELALKYYQEFIEQSSDDMTLQAELAATHQRIARITGEIGSAKDALESFQKSLEIRKRLADGSPDDAKYQVDLADSYRRTGQQLQKVGKTADALVSLRKAIEIWKKLAGEITGLPSHRGHLAMSHNSLGILQQDMGHTTEALASLQKAIEIKEELLIGNPDVHSHQSSLARFYGELSIVQCAMGHTTEALASLQTSIEILKKLAAENPDQLDYAHNLAASYSNVGTVQRNMGRAAEHPDYTEYRSRLCNAHLNLRTVYDRMGKKTEALASLQEAIDIDEKLAAETPDASLYQARLARSYDDLCSRQLDTGDAVEAIASIQKAIEIHDKLAAENPAVNEYRHGLAGAYCNLGVVQSRTGKLDEAIGSYQRAIKIQKELVGQNPTIVQYREWLGNHYNNLGLVLKNQGKLDEAFASLQRAIEIKQEIAAENPTVVAYQTSLAGAYTNLGHDLRAQGKQDEAVAQYREAIRIDPECTSALNSLAWVLVTSADLRLLNPRQALDHATKAVALSPEHADYRNTLGVDA